MPRTPLVPTRLLTCLSLCVVLGCSGEEDWPPLHDTAVGEDAQVIVSLTVSPGPESNKPLVFEVGLTNLEKVTLSGADVVFELTLAGHIPVVLSSSELNASGTYRSTPAALDTVGQWTLKVHVQKGEAVHDHATFELDVR